MSDVDAPISAGPGPLRFAYADPPYVGQSKRLYGAHPDYAGEVDHAELIARMNDEFDGWALSCSMKSLKALLALCPDDVLVLAWVKPNTAPPMGDHRHYSWEPVILRGGRKPALPTMLHLVANVEQYTFRDKPAGYVVGAKPAAFSLWLFRSAGLRPGDTFVDLFPGSGAVSAAWARYESEGVLCG